MKFGLIVIATLVASAFAAHFLLQDPGYVVISFRGYLIEMSVPVLVALVLFLLVLIWMFLKLIRAPRRLGEAAGRFRSGRSGQRLTKGMIEVAEGNFARGERLLARTAHRSDAPLLNYLQAARAAHLLGHDDRRDNWLRQAYEQTPEAADAVLLTQAELQLDQDQNEQALATLRKLEENTPNHARALVLLGRLYYRLEDWAHLGELLPKLKKHARMDQAALAEWSLRVYSEKLNAAADGNTLEIAWQAIPRATRPSRTAASGIPAPVPRATVAPASRRTGSNAPMRSRALSSRPSKRSDPSRYLEGSPNSHQKPSCRYAPTRMSSISVSRTPMCRAISTE